MIGFARAIAALGFDVVTFDFLYMERHRRMPDRAPVLEACYGAVITAVRDRVESARRSLFIGGKSMGGRIATQVAAADAGIRIEGLVLLLRLLNLVLLQLRDLVQQLHLKRASQQRQVLSITLLQRLAKFLAQGPEFLDKLDRFLRHNVEPIRRYRSAETRQYRADRETLCDSAD